MQYARERAQGLLIDLLKKKGIVSSSEDEIVCEAIVNFIITAAAHEMRRIKEMEQEVGNDGTGT